MAPRVLRDDILVVEQNPNKGTRLPLCLMRRRMTCQGTSVGLLNLCLPSTSAAAWPYYLQ